MTTLTKFLFFLPLLYCQEITPTFTKIPIDHTIFPSAIPNYPELFQTADATTFLIGRDSLQNSYVLHQVSVQDPPAVEVSADTSVVVPLEVP